MERFSSSMQTALWLILLEVLFFFPDVLGSAWASGKPIGSLTNGVLLLLTLLLFAIAYVAKSILQTRIQSMLLLDILMALFSNAAAALADIAVFNRSVNIPGLAVATTGLLIMTQSVSHLQRTGSRPESSRQKKYFVDVVIWIALLVILPGLSLSSLAAKTGLSMQVIVPGVALIASLFSKTGSNLQKQAFAKRKERKAVEAQSLLADQLSALLDDGAEIKAPAKSPGQEVRLQLIDEVFTHPRYLRGLLGSLASQILLALISVEAGITGVSIMRAFFSFGISSYLSFKEGDIVLQGRWGVAALVGFAIFLLSRLM
jgi:hypothetical protein